MDNFTMSQLRKELVHSKFSIQEYPNLMMQFLPLGVLNIFGKDPSIPIKHTYTLSHNNTDFCLHTAPLLIEGESDLKVLMMKNHITLVGIKDNTKQIHLSRLKLKVY